jgi:hypothetical protein
MRFYKRKTFKNAKAIYKKPATIGRIGKGRIGKGCKISRADCIRPALGHGLSKIKVWKQNSKIV